MSNLSYSFITLTIWHALQQPLPQRYVPLFQRKDCEPSQYVLCMDHGVEILCLPWDSFLSPMILSIKEKPPPTKLEETL